MFRIGEDSKLNGTLCHPKGQGTLRERKLKEETVEVVGFYGPLSSGSVMLHTHEPGAAPAQAWAPQRSVMVFLPGS